MRKLGGAVLALSVAIGLVRSAGEPYWDSPVPVEKIQQMVRDLEAAPLAKEADTLRAFLVKYFDSMRPEFVVCLGQFSPLMDAKKKAHKNLWLQVPIASGSYLLDHPEAIDDHVAYQLAGLEGMLRVYEKMLLAKPQLRYEFLDELLTLRDAGKLVEHVRVHVCDGDSTPTERRP